MLGDELSSVSDNIKTARVKKWLGIYANSADDELPSGAATSDSKNFRLEQEMLTNRKGSIAYGGASAGRVGSLGRFLNSTANVQVRQIGDEVQVFLNDDWYEIPSSRGAVLYANFINFKDYCFVLDGTNNMGLIEPESVTFASAPTTGDTSENLASNWTAASGVYPVVFASSGELRECTLTNGATSCTWSGALTANSDTTGSYTFGYSTPNTGIPNFKPLFGAIRTGKLYVSGNPSSPSAYYYSDTVTDANPEKIYAFASGTYGNNLLSSEIKGMAIVGDDPAAQTLIISTKTGAVGISSVTEEGSPIPQPLNAVSPFKNDRLVVAGDGVGMYLDDANKFRYLSSAGGRAGLANTNVSDPIDDLMLTLKEDQSKGWGYYYKPKRQFKFFLLQEGFDEPNICIIYDLRNQQFYLDKRSYSCGIMVDDTAYVGDSYSGQVYKDETGSNEKTVSPISFEFRTNKDPLGDPTRRKDFHEIRLAGRMTASSPPLVFEAYVEDKDGNAVLATSKTIDKSSTATAEYGGVGGVAVGESVVGGDVSSSGVAFKPFKCILKCRKRGYNVQVRIRCDGAGQDFQITRGYQIMYSPVDYDPSSSKS